MAKQLTEEEVAEYKEAFSLLDKDGDGSIKISLLPLLVRSLYLFPTEAELSEMTKEADPQHKGVLEFSDFLSLVARRPPDPEPEEELLEALEFFSENKEQQLIAVNQLRHHLTQQGERFSDAEMDDFLDFLNRSNLKLGNEVRYKDLAKLLINGYAS